MSTIVTIYPQTRFDFDSHVEFRREVKVALASPAKQIVIELSKVEYMDSSALGMLLLAQKDAAETGRKVILSHPNGYVRNILKTVYFDRKFEMIT